jgi:hypothetical protein
MVDAMAKFGNLMMMMMMMMTNGHIGLAVQRLQAATVL